MNFCVVLDFVQNSDKFNFLRTSLRIALKILQLDKNYHLTASVLSFIQITSEADVPRCSEK